MILRRMLAIWISKATCVVCKLAGKQGVTLAGKIALKIDPKILMELSGQVRKKIFITCGTNGKTTTTALLGAIMKNFRESTFVVGNIGNP